jgi:FkbM family methyltransferase
MIFPRVIHRLGELPAVGSPLRKASYAYREGSVAMIPFGLSAGAKWKRHHRYVSGYWLGIYEPKIQNALSRLISAGDVVYDVGANAGFFTLLAARLVGSRGRVFAFDPLPDNIASIREQIAVNSLTNCQAVQGAVSDRPGRASLTLAQNNSMAHISSENEPGDLDVEVIALDAFADVSRNTAATEGLAGHTLDVAAGDGSAPRPNVIKIDVEGPEAQVLEGAVKMLSSPSAPRLLIELHGHQVAVKVGSFLQNLGYRILDLDMVPVGADIGAAHHIVARKL